jgi:hypothetical protein
VEIARRGLLGLAAAAVVTLTSSCREQDGLPSGTAVAPAPSPTQQRARPRFAGDPGAGRLYYGASVPHGQSVTAWEKRLGSTLSVHRSYFSPDDNETAQLVAQCRDDFSHQRLPHVSVKPRWTWAEVASGGQDRWLDKTLRSLGELSSPIVFTLHHEPENDSGGVGMQPRDYVRMQRRLLDRAADLAPKVVIAPVLQHWTFDPTRDDIDPNEWLVRDAPVIGLDIYNPWSQESGKAWRSFGGKIDEVRGWFGDTPLIIAEYGCREDPADPGLTPEWLRDAADYARTHNIVSMSYFNSSVDAQGGTWALRGTAEDTFAGLLASEWVARTT